MHVEDCEYGGDGGAEREQGREEATRRKRVCDEQRLHLLAMAYGEDHRSSTMGARRAARCHSTVADGRTQPVFRCCVWKAP